MSDKLYKGECHICFDETESVSHTKRVCDRCSLAGHQNRPEELCARCKNIADWARVNHLIRRAEAR